MRHRRPGRRLEHGFLVVGSVAAVLGVVAYATHVFRPLERDSVDARFSIRGTQERPRDLVVVEIDDVTFDELDEQWPFPRTLHARVIDRLRRAGARAIAYDIQFTEPTTVHAGQRPDPRRGPRPPTSCSPPPRSTHGGGRTCSAARPSCGRIGARAGSTVSPPIRAVCSEELDYEFAGLKSFAVVAVESGTGQVGSARRSRYR